jgi:hypothetical protein
MDTGPRFGFGMLPPAAFDPLVGVHMLGCHFVSIEKPRNRADEQA